MPINTLDADQIRNQTVDWFRARVAQHYVDLSDADLAHVSSAIREVLDAKINNENILNKQLDPKTGEVKDVTTDA